MSPCPRPGGAAAWAAEATGTALLVLGALSAAALGAAPAPTAALVATVVAVLAASPLGRLSGAHLNPAVTLALRRLGAVGRGDAWAYAAAQVAGALAGGAAFRALWGARAAALGDGVTHPHIGVAAAVALEAAGTAALLATIVACVSSPRRARWTPLAIWPVLAGLVWVLGASTGASLNPARSAGPALAAGDLRDLWIYLVAPLAGALAVAAAARMAATRRGAGQPARAVA